MAPVVRDAAGFLEVLLCCADLMFPQLSKPLAIDDAVLRVVTEIWMYFFDPPVDLLSRHCAALKQVLDRIAEDRIDRPASDAYSQQLLFST